MKLVVGWLFCFGLAFGAEIGAGRTVYVMPMGHGLDQFVANQLTRDHVFEVVTDPSKADVVITDQVGKGFEDRLKDLLPPPPPPPADEEAKPAAKPKPAADAKEKGDTPPGSGLISMLGDTANKAQPQGYMSVYGRGRGTIFLVDVKSHRVLWSAFEKPNGSSPRELDHTAERIVKRLKEDLTPKTK